MVSVVGLPNRRQIKQGSGVWIETKEDQGTGKLTEGIVDQILTKLNTHTHGIMVRLENGSIGRVKKITKSGRPRESSNPPNTVQFEDLGKKEIPKTENRYNEFKEFYQYDEIMGRSWSVGADRKKSVFKDKKTRGTNTFCDSSLLLRERRRRLCIFGNKI